ncbi:glycosyltransferase [Sphingomonas rubra]|uniref:Glycosyl transferase family 1 n=1 Tax=Sphingomonas rubra TaxID=634430 RepID=A0A1I5PJK1_9SPHN|nr:glycosyltransferase [Sphingomonas rubra]SFP33980.1 Glycosyl transferase family 1 [Sphingomonas rubra]
MTVRARPIGYYVHHHGTGHRARAAAIAAAAPGRVVLLGTGLAGQVGDLAHIDLPDDRVDDAFAGRDAAATRPAALHYAPLDHAGIRARVAAITRWIDEAAPALIVIDVSVEMAMLARIASVPTVVVRLSGDRTDPAHLACFRGATALLSPFAAALDDPLIPADIAARTRYAPGLSPRAFAAPARPRQVTVILGTGGNTLPASVWADAARAVPDHDWLVLGHVAAPAESPANLTLAGWVDDVPARIARASVVIGGAGDGVVSAVLQARRPFICLPEPRPYDEQVGKAAALARAGAAIVCPDPVHADWPALVAAARGIDPAAQGALDDPDGSARTAAWLIDLADRGFPA